MTDIVAILDAMRAIAKGRFSEPVIRRARDEIVALREWKEAALRGVLPITFRADVLEEAARVVEEFPADEHFGALANAAAAIRALKDKP